MMYLELRKHCMNLQILLIDVLIVKTYGYGVLFWSHQNNIKPGLWNTIYETDKLTNL